MQRHEFKVCSQHGEDGILEYLHGKLRSKNYRFVEIGCSSGYECNSRYLLDKGFSGLAIDAGQKNIALYKAYHYEKLRALCVTVGKDTIAALYEKFPDDPDIFSLDIDSYDYYVADWLLQHGFRPKIACLEVNTFLGEDPVTVKHQEPFSRYAIQPKYGLYFGCSEAAWRHLWEPYGYRYCGMESSNTNVFFVRDCEDLDPPGKSGFQTYFVEKYGKTGERLREILRQDCEVLDVTSDAYKNSYKAFA